MKGDPHISKSIDSRQKILSTLALRAWNMPELSKEGEK